MKKRLFIPLFIIALLAITVFFSCKKTSTSPADTSEYIHYTINGTAYNFDMPADSVFADSVVETSTFLAGKNIYSKRNIAGTADITRIAYNMHNTLITAGSQVQLYSFYTVQTGFYPQFTTSASPVLINFTEVGVINEYLAGNFSAIFTGPPPANTTYNVICNFRVRRRI